MFFDDMTGERELSVREMQLRDLFVKEYLVDYDAISACLRCGFNSTIAPQYAQQFMEESYVQRKLRELQMTPSGDDSDNKDFEKQRVIAGLHREAHYRGPGSSHAARVAALSRLAAMYGLDKETQTVGDQSGVMVVPGVSSVDDWEQVATASQEKLVNDSLVVH